MLSFHLETYIPCFNATVKTTCSYSSISDTNDINFNPEHRWCIGEARGGGGGSMCPPWGRHLMARKWAALACAPPEKRQQQFQFCQWYFRYCSQYFLVQTPNPKLVIGCWCTTRLRRHHLLMLWVLQLKQGPKSQWGRPKPFYHGALALVWLVLGPTADFMCCGEKKYFLACPCTGSHTALNLQSIDFVPRRQNHKPES